MGVSQHFSKEFSINFVLFCPLQKAVVWTDVIQIILMYGTLVLIVIKGTMDVGGLSVVIARNYESGRFEAPE